MTPQDFLQFVFGDKADDETICICKGSYMTPEDAAKNKMTFWNLEPTHEAFTGWALRPARSRQAWYMCVSTVNGARNEKGTALRRGYDNLMRAHCLVLDDIGTKASAPPVEPAWKIETSAGNFQWGYLIEATDNFKRYEALLEWAHGQGWGDKGAGGAYRVVRIPGSCNIKAGKDKFIATVEIGDDIVWPLEDLGKALGITDAEWRELEAGTSAGKKARVSRTGGAMAEATPIEDPLLTWLASSGFVVEDRGDKVDIVCPWASAHTDGNNIATYWPFGRGDRPEGRGFKCLHGHCADRRYRDLREWAVGLGGPDLPGYDPLPFLQARWVYVDEPREFADMIQRPRGGVWRYSESSWSNMHHRRVDVPGHEKPVMIKSAMLESRETRHAVTYAYVPGQGELATVKEQVLVNTYAPPQVAETTELPAIFLEHVAYLLPNIEDRELFHDWLAYKLQNPASRSYAVVMVADGAFGIGRSWLGRLLRKMLSGGVETVSLATLIGKGSVADKTYNDWAVGCQFVVVEEAKDVSRDDFWQAYDTFKERIDNSPSEVRVNEKYGLTRYDMMYFNALIFSNHSDALVLPPDDRRVAVLVNPSVRRSPDYYTRLEGSLSTGEADRAYWWLMRRDVSKYDHVYPPMNDAKGAMIEQTRSAGDEIEEYVIEHLEGDLVTRKMLLARVKSAARELAHEKVEISPGGVAGRMWKRLGSLRPGVKNGARYLIDTTTDEMRAVRNKQKWKTADAHRDRDAIIAEFKKNKTDVVQLPARG